LIGGERPNDDKDPNIPKIRVPKESHVGRTRATVNPKKKNPNRGKLVPSGEKRGITSYCSENYFSGKSRVQTTITKKHSSLKKTLMELSREPKNRGRNSSSPGGGMKAVKKANNISVSEGKSSNAKRRRLLKTDRAKKGGSGRKGGLSRVAVKEEGAGGIKKTDLWAKKDSSIRPKHGTEGKGLFRGVVLVVGKRQAGGQKMCRGD